MHWTRGSDVREAQEMVRQVKLSKTNTVTLKFFRGNLLTSDPALQPSQVASLGLWAVVTFCAAARSRSSLYLKLSPN